jgi:putative inorganic carbon (HCO3(-)) transporter
MRSIALFLELLVLVPIALLRPFVGVVLWSWISFMNPHQLVFGGAPDMPWALIIFCATMVGCLIAREPKRFPVNAVTVQIVLFLVLISFTSLFALAPWESVEAKWELTFKAFLFVLVTAALLTSKERIHALIWIMAISLAYFGVKGGGFTLLGGGGQLVYGPPSSMISDNNHLAVAMLVALPLMNYLRLESRHVIVRYGFLAVMTLTLFAVVGSYSRGALLALAAVAGFFWLKSSKKLVSGIFIVLALVVSINFMPERWTNRMSTIEAYQADGSAVTRLEMWHLAWTIATGLV